MEYSCEKYLKSNKGDKFFVGDKVRISKEGVGQFYGTITAITDIGICAECRAIGNRYFRSENIDEIAVVE